MKRSIRGSVAVAVAGVALLASVVHAGPALTVTSPLPGETFSRAIYDTIAVTGTAAFDAPVDSLRRFYVRRDDCGGTDNERLSTYSGADGGTGCGDLRSGVPTEVFRTAGQSNMPGFGSLFSDFSAENGVPAVLGAGNIAGQIVYEGDGVQAGLGKLEVEVVAGGATLGTAVVEKTIDPQASSTTYDFSFAVPANKVGTNVNSLTLRVAMRGVMVIESGGFMVLNGASYFDLPIKDAGQVEVSTSASFPEGKTDVTRPGTDGTWAAEVVTPTAGNRTIFVRAIQGTSIVSTTVAIKVIN